MGVRASMATTYYEDNYRGYRHHYPRTGHHQKKDFWGADYPVAPAVTPQTLGVFPAAYDRGVARRWRTEALTSAPPPIPPPATCPSPHKLIGREADISEAVGFMSMEHHMHPHAGATPAHSCVQAIAEDRAARIQSAIDAQRRRLDAPYAFGPRSKQCGGEFAYQLADPYRTRTPRAGVLYPKVDRLPGYIPSVQGAGGRGNFELSTYM